MLQKIIQKISEAGGTVMFVGGCVRDELLGLTPKDFDIEVYHIEPTRLREILESCGKVDAVGASFQVYKMGKYDISLPRRDRKVGKGHKGFVIEGDKDMSFKEAASRRDITINAIMKNAVTGELIDPFNGVSDLNNGLLRVVSPNSFQEDSLRVLRLAQFASRFQFDIEEETFKLAKAVDLSDLPKERIWMELEKIFLKSPKPSVGIRWLEKLGVIGTVLPNMFSLLVDSAVPFMDTLSYPEKITVMLALSSRLDLLETLNIHTLDNYPVREQFLELVKLSQTSGYFTEYDLKWLARKVRLNLLVVIFKALNHPDSLFVEEVVKKWGIQTHPIEPIVKGRHLIEWGHQPSPKFGEWLETLYNEQLKNHFKTLEEGKEILGYLI